jgi:aspartate/methionine/tyrosine aminotransferase
VIHLEIGQPSTGAPQAALDRLARDMEAGPLGYTQGLGLPELRARIARHYGDQHGLDLDPSRVVVTPGASGAFLLAFAALFDNGARVGLAAPGYPSYRQILRGMGLTPVNLVAKETAGFQPEPGDLSPDLAGLIVASPANPTGAMLDRPAIAALADACMVRDIALISDEIYHHLDYGKPSVSALQVTDQVYVINSFSKYFSMTGWRVGWMVVPPEHVRTVERLAQNFFLCTGHAAQRLALYAFDAQAELDANLAIYRANRALLLAGLADAGLPRFIPPDGAFYVYAQVSHTGIDSLTLCRRALDEAGVAITPGLDFDPDRGQDWVRLSYAGSTADVAEGLARLKRFFGGL